VPEFGGGRFFASDNAAGIHPAVLDALRDANQGHALGYGNDAWTRRAVEVLRGHFGAGAEVLLVFGGTGANVVALRAAVDSHQAVICSDHAHLYRDECGAPERLVGCKLLPVAGVHGKITAAQARAHLWTRGGVHYAQPRLVSVSQATECGTLYAPEELRALADFAHDNGLLLHVDGARLANAAAALGTSLRALTADAGVDLLSLGGTKCGLLGAEAVVLLRPELAERAPFYRKQCAQLPSKSRFLAAQLTALYGGELWRELAGHANAMARRLADAVAGVVEPAHPVETNAVFARLPEAAIAPLRERFIFNPWPPEPGLVRWMTSWDTRPEDVDAFGRAVREVVGGAASRS
jgi:threonine aldolase